MKKNHITTILIGLLTSYGILTWANSEMHHLLLSLLITAVWGGCYVFIIRQPKMEVHSITKGFSFILALFLLGFTNLTIDRPLPFLVQPYTLSIVPTVDETQSMTDETIQISEIGLNNEPIDFETLTQTGDWTFKETLVAPATSTTPLSFSNLTNELVSISLIKDKQGGEVSIYQNDRLVKTVNLQSATEQNIKIKVSPDYHLLLPLAYIGVFIAVHLVIQFIFTTFLAAKLKLPTTLTLPTIFYLSLPALTIALFKFIGLRNVQYRSILMLIFFIFIIGSERVLWKKAKVENQPRYLEIGRAVFYLLMTSILTVILMQVIYFFPNFDVTQTWISHHINLIFLTSTIILSVSIILYALFNHLLLAISLSSLTFLIVGIANYYKMLVVGEPIYPSDMSMLANMDDIIGYVKNILSPSLLIALLIVVLSLAGLCFIYRKGFKLKWKARVVLAIGFSAYLGLTFNYEKTIMNPLVNRTINFSKWNQLSNYEQNGFIFGFITNLQNETMVKPEAYSEEVLQQIMDEYIEKANVHNENLPATIKPNIVTIVSESLSDPTVFDQLTFSEDPLPNLKAYQETSSSGRFLSPFKGNRTANVEFEYLLSFTNSLLLEGTVPFQQALSRKDEIPSFVSYLGDLGYDSVAIHPNNAAFYKRSSVYPALGFGEFLSIDKMRHLEYIESQKYVSDQSVFDELYLELESAEQPIFAYGLTMANHIAIFEDKFGETTIEVTDPLGNPDREMEIYAEGLKQTDAQLKEFITKIQNTEEPTLVVFFGDHLINFQSDVHANHGFIDKDTDAQRAKKFFETPLLLLSNFDDFEMNDLNSISPIFLAPLISKELNLPLSPFYLLLLDLYEEFSVLHNNFKLDREQNQVFELTQPQQNLLSVLELIQYDILEGKEYTLNTFFTAE